LTGERALRRSHQIGVDGETDVVPGNGGLLLRLVEKRQILLAGALVAACVEDDFLPTALPAKVGLPRALDAGTPDAVAGLQRAAALGREVFLGDLVHVAEQVEAQVLAGVVAHRHR